MGNLFKSFGYTFETYLRQSLIFSHLFPTVNFITKDLFLVGNLEDFDIKMFQNWRLCKGCGSQTIKLLNMLKQRMKSEKERWSHWRSTDETEFIYFSLIYFMFRFLWDSSSWWDFPPTILQVLYKFNIQRQSYFDNSN